MPRNKRNMFRSYISGLFKMRTSSCSESSSKNYNKSDLSGILSEDKDKIYAKFKNDGLLMSKEIRSAGCDPVVGRVFFFDGMCNDAQVASDYIKPIVLYDGVKLSVEEIASDLVFGNDLKISDKLDDMISAILMGNSVFIFDGERKAIIADTKKIQNRTVSEPENEKVIKGPHEGFIEDIVANVCLLKKRIQSHTFKCEFLTVGRRTNTRVAVCYMDGVCDKRVLGDVKNRLKQIEIDGVLDANYISELISDTPYSPLPTIGSTERPDSVAGKLLEGRIAIIVNGSPEILTVPYLFVENFQSSEDYYMNFIYATFVRILRVFSFFVTIFLPGSFVALLSYHTQIIPVELLLSIIGTREGVPFPSVVECALLILIFEIIREAGVRVPSSVSQPLSIVGAIVLGDAAVNARIVSSTMVIIVAMTALCGLMTVHLKSAVITYRLLILLLGSLLGLYGVLFGFMFICFSVLGMESFGVRYSEYSIFEPSALNKDKLRRTTWKKMITRPESISKNTVRQTRGN